VGKPTGIDIIEKKMTLPLIHALNSSTKNEKRTILRLLQKDKKTKLEIQDVISFVKSKGGINYAQLKMLEYKQKAEEILSSIPTKASTSYLLALINFVIERKK
jgi:octaprenyl-diphosphate synthase